MSDVLHKKPSLRVKVARLSCWSVAPTAMTLGYFNARLAGYSGRSSPSFPAAATIMTPRSFANETALSKAPEPSTVALTFTTASPKLTASAIPLATAEVVTPVRSPAGEFTFSATTTVSKAGLAIPRPLLLKAAAKPATKVPCPSSSSVEMLVLLHAPPEIEPHQFKPESTRPNRYSCEELIPLSTNPIGTPPFSPRLCATDHASVVFICFKYH